MADINVALRRRIDEYVNALEVNDFERAANVYAPDGQLLAPNKTTFVGIQGMLSFNDGLSKEGRPTLEVTKVDDAELLTPEWAIVTLFFYLVLDGKKSSLSKNFVLWKKIGDEWFVYRSMYNDEPTKRDTDKPTKRDTDEPTKGDTEESTKGDTEESTKGDTDEPTKGDTEEPTKGDTEEPTKGDTEELTKGDTDEPTKGDTDEPTKGDTDEPTKGDTDEPTKGDTDEPTKGGTDV